MQATRILTSTKTAEVLGRRLERKNNEVAKLKRQVAKQAKRIAELEAALEFTGGEKHGDDYD